jgi:hypothetical protein
MKVKELKERLGLALLCEGDTDRECEGCYCGDLLSWVMSKAKENDVWLTVMGNVNAVAVAVLTDCACIVLTESAHLDEDAETRARQQGVTILQSEKSAYELAVLISELL